MRVNEEEQQRQAVARQRQAVLAKNEETRKTFVAKKLQAIAIFAGATVVLFGIGGNAIWLG